MGFYIRAVHHRNPGKHCVNHLFSPDAECRARGWRWVDGWVGGFVAGGGSGLKPRGEM